MGRVAKVKIGEIEGLAVKSELHLATDGITAPIVALWQQMISEVRPKLVMYHRDCRRNRTRYPARRRFRRDQRQIQLREGLQEQALGPAALHRAGDAGGWVRGGLRRLVAPTPGSFAGRHRAPMLTFGAATGGVETVDYFGFANTTDSFGVVRNYPDARTEEMDDAALPLALDTLSDPPRGARSVTPATRSLVGHRRPARPGANGPARSTSGTATGLPSGRPWPPGRLSRTWAEPYD